MQQHAAQPGQIVILNGTPRSGKTSIAAAIQQTWDGVWMNLGVDGFFRMTPERYRPGIGLRPGGERPDLEPHIEVMYRAMYQAIAAHSRVGLNVMVDVGHHDGYSVPRGILPMCARELDGLTALFVGVRCPIETIRERLLATRGADFFDVPVPRPIERWQRVVHEPGIYDLEVDTSVLSPEACADLIRQRIANGPPPNALRQLAAMSGG